MLASVSSWQQDVVSCKHTLASLRVRVLAGHAAFMPSFPGFTVSVRMLLSSSRCRQRSYDNELRRLDGADGAARQCKLHYPRDRVNIRKRMERRCVAGAAEICHIQPE